MLNALTVDIEDYFHVEAFASVIDPAEWDNYPCRVEQNVDRILEIFHRFGVRATFFVLGWVAERYPRMVPEILEAGHEIGCHGYGHQHLGRLTPSEFRDDVRRSARCLADQAGARIELFRAPSFSIVQSTLWAVDILAEEGFTLDSSIFPGRHDVYGIPGAPRFPHCLTTFAGNSLIEFPPSTVHLFGNNWGTGGGGYLRIFPYFLTRLALRRINNRENQPFMVYFHPWELDPDQPRIKSNARSRLRQYTNLSVMQAKLENLLRDFCFSAVSDVIRNHAIPVPALAVSGNIGLAKKEV